MLKKSVLVTAIFSLICAASLSAATDRQTLNKPVQFMKEKPAYMMLAASEKIIERTT